MNETAFQQFVNLITFDRKLGTTRTDMHKLQQEIDLLGQQEEELRMQLQAAEKVVHDTRKIVDQNELEMSSLDEAEKQAKKRIDTASNDKEYQALKKEIAQLRQKQHDYEETLVSAWSQLEAAQATYDKQKTVYNQQADELQQKISHNHDAIAQLQEKIDAHEQERSALETGIPEEWLESYARMRERVDNPVVPVEGKNCGACYTDVTDQDFMRLRRHALVNCKGCFRLLYMQGALAQPEGEQAAS